MKSLSRVILINWYLFEYEEWDIRGHVALLGKNGSGKSSFLDALQLVLLGGNKQDWNPNAKASESSGERDIRSYALGLVKDESAIGDAVQYQPREDALTRIVLVFKDHDTGNSTSVGVAITASRSDPQEHFEGFFILRDQELQLSDLIEETDEGATPYSYNHLKAFFAKNSKMSLDTDEEDRDLYLFGHEPGKFVEQMLRTLGGSKYPPAPEKFRRAFKQSIKLSGIDGSVSDFVKRSILDASPINLNMMRQSIETLNNKKEAVLRAKEQIKRLDAIDKQFTRALNAGKRHIGYQWCAAEFRFYANESHIDELNDDLTGLAHDYSQSKRSLAETRSQLKDGLEKRDELNTLINQDDAKTKKNELELKQQNNTLRANTLSNTVESIKQTILAGDEILIHQDLLPKPLVTPIQNTIETIQTAGEFWQDQSESLTHSLIDIQNQIPQASTQLQEVQGQFYVDVDKTREALNEVGKQLENLESGQYNLRPDTQALMLELEKQGISSTPVCELIEVSDPEWQPAIEAYLRKNTEALVVDIDQSKQAIELYRSLKRRTHIQAIVIDAEKVSTWSVDCTDNTAPTLIKGDNFTAVTFIQRLLTGIELHNDTAKIRQAKRALAKDGSFQSSAAFTRLRLPNFSILGQGAIESQKAYLTNERDGLTQKLIDQNKQLTQTTKAIQTLSDYKNQLTHAHELNIQVKDLTRLEKEIGDLTDKIKNIDVGHLADLETQLEKIEFENEHLNKQKDKLIRDRSTFTNKFRQKNRERRSLTKLESKLNQDRQQWTEEKSFNAELTDQLYTEIEEKFTPDTFESFNQCIELCIKRSRDAEKLKTNAEMRGKEEFAEYTTRYPDSSLGSQILSLEGYSAEVSTRLQNIKEIGLHEREQEVHDALYKLTQAIRSDLSLKLRGQINEMKRRFDELNKELKDRPFSANQKYRFHYARVTEYDEFLSYVENVNDETVADVDSLFDQSSYINDVIEKILDDTSGDELGDYRNYYTFDIKIKDTESGIEESFSKTKGKDSGGEYMTPFYVAMGASLAGAYRFNTREDGNIESGLALFPSDEAFKNMDYANTNQAAEYLKSIGLQLFVAAPDSAEPEFRSFADTVLFFIREGSTAAISVDYVTPWAQNLIQNAFKGEIVEHA